MKIACVGGGPASLFFAILMKREASGCDVTVYERNPAGTTYGWGVTYSDDLRDNLRFADPETARAVIDNSVSWSEWLVHLPDRPGLVMNDEYGGYGISRHRLLDVLTKRAHALGVRIETERTVTGPADVADADLVVAADGASSVLREHHVEQFGTEIEVGRNPYIWLGTTKVFDAFAFAFAETEHGWVWCYGYKYSDQYSTAVIECGPETWTGLGFDRMPQAECLAVLEKLFAGILDGHPLMGHEAADGTARWLNFRTVTNRNWSHDNVVLLGDAAHTTHYSVGLGTALALGDAAVLALALHEEPTFAAAFARYERIRKDEVVMEQRAAGYSARWFEELHRYIDLPTKQLLALLSFRHSSVLPHLPPRVYYGLGWTASRLLSVTGGRRLLARVRQGRLRQATQTR
jgi:anthraniloyl-CoA monooxygenase